MRVVGGTFGAINLVQEQSASFGASPSSYWPAKADGEAGPLAMDRGDVTFRMFRLVCCLAANPPSFVFKLGLILMVSLSL